MTLTRRIILFFSLCVLSFGAAFAQSSDSENMSLGDIARQYRGNKTAAPPVQDDSSAPRVARKQDAETAYKHLVEEMLLRGDFPALDAEAGRARESKERFPGGVWKLYIFYEYLGSPSGDRKASHSAWITHINRLKRWVAAEPESQTALIALAQAYADFGFAQRGVEFSDRVTDEQWKGLADSTRLAMETLVKAAKLPNRCPHWYYTMQEVAMAAGAPPPVLKGLVDELLKVEPNYYHVYRGVATYLEPKWYGEPGDVSRFADLVASRVGGSDGEFAYFEIASVTYCNCGDERANTFSWPRIKKGYESMQKLYGTSNLKLNRFAFMATKFGDRAAAKQAFNSIGDEWDHYIWGPQWEFERARLWAQQK